MPVLLFTMVTATMRQPSGDVVAPVPDEDAGCTEIVVIAAEQSPDTDSVAAA